MFDTLRSRILYFGMLKISSYSLRAFLSTPQITPHISKHLFPITRPLPPHRIRLHILIEQFIRVKIRTIPRQKEQPYFIPMLPHPMLYPPRNMDRMLIDNEKYSSAPMMPNQTLQKPDKDPRGELLSKHHKSQFPPIRNRRDQITPKPLTRPRNHRSFSLPTIRSSRLMIRPHPHLIPPEDSRPLSSGPLLDGRILPGQPTPHRLRIPLISPAQRLLGRKPPPLQIPTHRPNRKPDPKAPNNQIPHRLPGPKHKGQLQLVRTTIHNQTNHHRGLPGQQPNRRGTAPSTRTQPPDSLLQPQPIPLVDRLSGNPKDSGCLCLTQPFANRLDYPFSQSILSRWRQKSYVFLFHVSNNNTYTSLCQTFYALISNKFHNSPSPLLFLRGGYTLPFS